MVILISQKIIKTKFRKIDVLEEDYTKFFKNFGLLIPISNFSDLQKYKSMKIDGIILSGGNDVNPLLYEDKIKEELDLVEERDVIEKEIIKLAIDKNIPLLGICRGMQMINIYFNGKLSKVQGHVKEKHQLKIIDEKFKKIIGNSIVTNSYHNWGIKHKDLAPQMKSFAESEDGLIEGIYHPKYSILGLQWHPERKNTDQEKINKLIKLYLGEIKLKQ